MKNPLHPGEIVKDALDGIGMSVEDAVTILGVSPISLSNLINCKSTITPDMANRLSKLFNTSIEHWLNLQSQYDSN